MNPVISKPTATAPLEHDGVVPPAQGNYLTRTWGLPNEMRKRVKGEVRFDDGSRALYATDGSNYQANVEWRGVAEEPGGRDQRDRGRVSSRRLNTL